MISHCLLFIVSCCLTVVGSLCFKNCLIRSGLHVDEGSQSDTQLEPKPGGHRPHVAWRLYHQKVSHHPHVAGGAVLSEGNLTNLWSDGPK